MTRNPRLPNGARTRPSPGQMALWDRPTYTVLLQNGRTLQVLPGGRHVAPSPAPAPIARKAAAA